MALGTILLEARTKLNLTASEVAAATRMKVQLIEAIENEDFSAMAAPIYAKGFIRLYADYVGIDPRPLVQEYIERHVSAPKTPSLVSEEDAPAPDPPAEDADRKPSRKRKREKKQQEPRRPVVSELDLFNEVGDDEEPAATTETPEAAAPAEASGEPHIPAEPESPAVEPTRPPPGERPAASPQQLLRMISARTVAEIRGMNLKQSPLKAISLVAGVLLLLVFIFSAASNCIRRPEPPRPQASAPTPSTWTVAIEAEQPYID